MSPFPGIADHWHLSSTRSGKLQTTPEPMDKPTARKMLRDLLIADGKQTRDHQGYQWAINVIDAGWCSVEIRGIQYCAFACACPPLPKGGDQQWQR